MEFSVNGGYVIYEDDTITGFGGRIESVVIPEELDIKYIAKKAFFGAKNLNQVILPDTIVKIGEWAFASCSSLKRFTALGKPEFLQGVFLNDESLNEIHIKGGERFAALLSAVCTQMNSEYLLTPDEAGSIEWYNKFDSRLLDILKEDDSAGYEKYVLCGEEDLLFDINVYIKSNQKRKNSLVYLRLIYDDMLREENKAFLEKYLKNTAVGKENESGFLVLLEHSSDDMYIDLYLKLGMLDEDNFENTIQRLGQKHATLKAKMIQYHDSMEKKDFFDDMLL